MYLATIILIAGLTSTLVTFFLCKFILGLEYNELAYLVNEKTGLADNEQEHVEETDIDMTDREVAGLDNELSGSDLIPEEVEVILHLLETGQNPRNSRVAQIDLHKDYVDINSVSEDVRTRYRLFLN